MTDVEQVRHVFAEVTRYPLELLDVEASLEEELGLDSVKLGEVFSVLRERFRLPKELDIPRGDLGSITEVTKALSTYIGSNKKDLPSFPGDGAAQGPYPNPRPAATHEPGTLSRVKAVFVEVTRYPEELLDPTASLEEELGLDSVKLGEVFAVLRERFSLPQDFHVPVEKLRTIASVAEALDAYLGQPASQAKAHATPVELPNVELPDVVELLLEVFAEVTRYPREILDPAANLEEDLGLDSVKLGEVFAVVRERYRLPEHLVIPPAESQTIHKIAAALAKYLAPAAPVTASAVAPSEPAAIRDHAVPAVKPLAGKVAFISGSGRGLGKDLALYLGELGASVIVNSFHSREKGDETAEEICRQKGDAIHLWGSMANPDHIQRIFDNIEHHYGHLDFLVANASNGMLAPLKDITVEHWEKAYRTNVIGLHQSALRSVPLMRRRGGGKIITLSSPAAHGYVDYFGCMGTVKAAVESLTRSMAIEFAPDNIQVNCVSPGPIYGELLDKWPESERLVRQWESNTAYTRLCQPRDVSHFIGYLLSEPVKLFTGSVLVVDGGISSRGW